jgi:uncharacterized membrane protein YphA (DoxX/SURF4 family)
MNRAGAAAPVILRYGMTAVHLWFGIAQLIDPASWVGWVPVWMTNIGLPAGTVVIVNAVFQTVFGVLLGIGLFTRLSAALFTVQMVVITIGVGMNAIGVRDFGLVVGSLSIFLYGPDALCLDTKLGRG